MNNCSQAPQTDATRRRWMHTSDPGTRTGWTGTRGWPRSSWRGGVRAADQRRRPDEIAVIQLGVARRQARVASALNVRRRATTRVVASEAEFPTVGHVWLAQERRGAERVVGAAVRARRDRHERLRDAHRRPNRVVSRMPRLFRERVRAGRRARSRAWRTTRGALLFVDAYQTLGTMPIDVIALDVDFLAAGNLKFLMGIPGIAFLYSSGERSLTLRPTVTGWFGRADPFAFDPKIARLVADGESLRYRHAAESINAYIARAGMEIVNEVGPANDPPRGREMLSRRHDRRRPARGL